MSFSHTQKRKTICRLKKEYGERWYPKYADRVAQIQKEMLREPIGTLADIMGAIHGEVDQEGRPSELPTR